MFEFWRALFNRALQFAFQKNDVPPATAKAPGAQAQLQRQIDATDRQIDRLVYELYETEEQIGVVEDANQQ